MRGGAIAMEHDLVAVMLAQTSLVLSTGIFSRLGPSVTSDRGGDRSRVSNGNAW